MDLELPCEAYYVYGIREGNASELVTHSELKMRNYKDATHLNE